MDTKDIQLFIDETIYDFQTIMYFLDYGRIKETIPLMRQILARIQSFRDRIDTGSYEFKHIFAQEIKTLPEYSMPFSEKNLQEYRQFIKATRVWAYDNIYQLRQIIKSPRQKKIEFIFIALSAGVLGVCLAVFMFLGLFLQDWGLKGDFYMGENFEKYVSSGGSKTINFESYREMNPHMPSVHASAHWQGFLITPKDGTYTLSMVVDDGARLFIDNHLLIDAWRDNDSVEFSQKVLLNKGEHALRLDYYNDLYQSVFRLYWAFNGGKKEIIPAWYLRHKG